MFEQTQEPVLANQLRAHALFGQLPEDAECAREIVALFTAFADEAGLKRLRQRTDVLVAAAG